VHIYDNLKNQDNSATQIDPISQTISVTRLNTKDPQGMMALHFAAANKHDEMVS